MSKGVSPGELEPFKIIPADFGPIYSWSTFDLGRTPRWSSISDIDVYRKELGDIAFVGRYDRSGKLCDLFFVPEYPEEHFARLSPVMAYYGVLLTQSGFNRPFEIMASDASCRPIDWDAGMAIVKKLKNKNSSTLQQKMFQLILDLDRRSKSFKPNLERNEMRRRVGTSLGARVSTGGLLLGYAN